MTGAIVDILGPNMVIERKKCNLVLTISVQLGPTAKLHVLLTPEFSIGLNGPIAFPHDFHITLWLSSHRSVHLSVCMYAHMYVDIRCFCGGRKFLNGILRVLKFYFF